MPGARTVRTSSSRCIVLRAECVSDAAVVAVGDAADVPSARDSDPGRGAPCRPLAVSISNCSVTFRAMRTPASSLRCVGAGVMAIHLGGMQVRACPNNVPGLRVLVQRVQMRHARVGFADDFVGFRDGDNQTFTDLAGGLHQPHGAFPDDEEVVGAARPLRGDKLPAPLQQLGGLGFHEVVRTGPPRRQVALHRRRPVFDAAVDFQVQGAVPGFVAAAPPAVGAVV